MGTRITRLTFRFALLALLSIILVGCSVVRGAEPQDHPAGNPDSSLTAPQQEPAPALAAPLPGKFLFVREGSIWLMQGTNAQVQLQTKRGIFYTQPAWSPDGQNLLAVEQGMNHSDIVLLAPTGAYVRPLTDYRNQFNHLASSWAFFPAWSPDGKNVAYITDKNTTGGRYMQLYVITPDGTVARRTPYYFDRLAAMEWPKWSPDGKQILLTGWPWVKGPSQLFQVDLATGVFTQLTNSEQSANDGAWSPDGKKVAFTQRTNGTHDIWVLDIANNKVQQVTTTGANRQPVWVNAQTIAYLSVGAAGAEIWSVAVNERDSRLIADPPQQHTDFTRAGREAIDATGGLGWSAR